MGTLEANGNTRGAKGGLYEGGLKVPCIFWGGFSQANRKIQKPIVGYDLASTILSFAQIEANYHTDGLNLSDVIKGSEMPRREYIYWENYQGNTRQALLLDDHYKVVRTRNAQNTLDISLYDLDQDPKEQNNLAGESQYETLVKRAIEILKKEHT